MTRCTWWASGSVCGWGCPFAVCCRQSVKNFKDFRWDTRSSHTGASQPRTDPDTRRWGTAWPSLSYSGLVGGFRWLLMDSSCKATNEE